MHGATGHFRLHGWDYDSYVPIVHGALENLHFLITASKRGADTTVVRATPRTAGDRAVEIEVRRQADRVEVRVLVIPLAVAPSEPHRFLIEEPASADLGGDGKSRHLLRRLLATLRRDSAHPRADPAAAGGTTEVHTSIFFHFRPGITMWVLGTLISTGGLAWLLFFARDGEYQTRPVVIGSLAFGAIPLVGGLWGRSGLRGASSGFLSVLAATFVYALSISGLLWPDLTSTQALAAIAPRTAFQGMWAVALSCAFAAAGSLAGGIGGLVGGVILPLLPARHVTPAGT